MSVQTRELCSAPLCSASRAPERAGQASRSLLEVENLRVEFWFDGQAVLSVKGLSYRLEAGRTLAIVGQSGSGKTVGCRALVGLLPDTCRVAGSVRFMGTELLALSEREMRLHRGASIAMAFQDSDRALNPTMRVGEQIAEAVNAHDAVSGRAARQRALELLHVLELPSPRDYFRAYPHQLSGGMRQRVSIAIAIAASPKILIADEPTSALDAITRMSMMETLVALQRRFGMALVLISHDLRLVGGVADDVLVMRGGQQIEYGPSRQVLENPATPYTKALLEAAEMAVAPQDGKPALAARTGRDELRRARLYGAAPVRCGIDSASGGEAAVPNVLEARGIVREFAAPGSPRVVRAVSGVSLAVHSGETLGLVGETGSGKSTLARALVLAPPPSAGSVLFRGTDLTRLRRRDAFEHRRHVQMIFQDPFGSLNPKWRVGRIVEEPLAGFGIGDKRERQRRVAEVLSLVGLPSGIARRRPRQLSGGECQRVAIARALAPNPTLLICDEALSSVDVVSQSDLLSLFRDLRAKLGLAYLFISHDLDLIRRISDRVAVMYLGQLCEVAPAEALWRMPAHPYTAALLAATSSRSTAPPSDRERGAAVSSANELQVPPQQRGGCRFRARCIRARERCEVDEPRMRDVGNDHSVACHYPVVPETAALAGAIA